MAFTKAVTKKFKFMGGERQRRIKSPEVIMMTTEEKNLQKQIIKNCIKLEKKSQKGVIHKLARFAATYGAAASVGTGIATSTIALGNGISKAITGDQLHGGAAAVTGTVAVTLGATAASHTAVAVGNMFDMTDEWRLKKMEEMEENLDENVVWED